MTGMPTVFYLTKDKCLNDQGVSKRWRGIVTGKTVEHPVYTVEPRIEWVHDAACGQRWQFEDDNKNLVNIVIRPKTDVFIVQIQGGGYLTNVRVLGETWEKIKVGDILEGCNGFQDGVNSSDTDRTTIANVEFTIGDKSIEPGSASMQKLFPAMMEAMRKKLVEGDAAVCAKEAREAAKLAREKKEHPDRFNDYGDRMTD
jgi:hypothetical protein